MKAGCLWVVPNPGSFGREPRCVGAPFMTLVISIFPFLSLFMEEEGRQPDVYLTGLSGGRAGGASDTVRSAWQRVTKYCAQSDRILLLR